MPSKRRRGRGARSKVGVAFGEEQEGVWEDLWALEALEALAAGHDKKEYRLRFYTGDKQGQEPPVAFVTIVGEKGMSGERPLSLATFLPPPDTPAKRAGGRPGGAGASVLHPLGRVTDKEAAAAAAATRAQDAGNILGPGRRSTFSILSKDVGRVQSLFIRIEQGGRGSWYLERCICFLPRDDPGGDEITSDTYANWSGVAPLDVARGCDARGEDMRRPGGVESRRVMGGRAGGGEGGRGRKPLEKVVFPCYSWFASDLGDLSLSLLCLSLSLSLSPSLPPSFCFVCVSVFLLFSPGSRRILMREGERK